MNLTLRLYKCRYGKSLVVRVACSLFGIPHSQCFKCG